MLKKLAKLSLLCAAVSMGAVQAQTARGIDGPQVSITPGEPQSAIEVISTDGERWTEIRESKLKFPTTITMSTNSGHLIGYKVSLDTQSLIHKIFAPLIPVQYTKSMTLKAATKDYNSTWQRRIIAMCNDKLANGKGVDESYTLSYDTTLFMVAWADRNSDGTSTGYTRNAPVSIPVKCIGYPKPYSVDVFVTKKGETCPKETEVRTLLKFRTPATARFYFKLDGNRSQLHTIKARKTDDKPSGGPGGTYVVERIKTYHLDPGTHSVRIEVLGTNKTASKTFVIDCPPFKVFSSWLKYDVEDTPVCDKTVKEVAIFKSTRPGSAPFHIKTQGGLIVNSGMAKFERKGREYVAKIKRKLKMGAFDSDMMAEITTDPAANSGWTRLKVECLEVTGDFSFIDNGGPRCPREGKALINFSMNVSADIHYSLDCTNGHFSGIAKAVAGNNGGYVAPALVKFDIEKTTQATCALKSVAPGKTKVHTFKGHLFQCITPAGHSGSNDMAPETRPNPDAPRTPDKVVVDPPRTPDKADVVPPRYPSNGQLDATIVTGTKATCAGGIATKRGCKCHKRTHRPVKVAKKAWRCVKKVVIDPVRPDKDKAGSTAGRGGRKVKTAVPPKRKLKIKRKKRRSAGKRRKNRAMRLR